MCRTKCEEQPSHCTSDKIILIQTRPGSTASGANDLRGPYKCIYCTNGEQGQNRRKYQVEETDHGNHNQEPYICDERQVLSNESSDDTDSQNLVCGATDRRDLVALRSPTLPVAFGSAFDSEGDVEPGSIG